MSPTDVNARNWERLCEWMEPKPDLPFVFSVGMPSPKGFWELAHRNSNYLWIYSKPSLDLCALAEAEIKRRGLQQQYVNAIFTIVAAEPVAWQGVLTLICLTPAQRCEAMLKAIESSRDPQP